MRSRLNFRSGTALFLAVVLAGAPGTGRTQEKSAAEEQLRKELDTVKEQLRRVEEQLTQQDELIRRLIGEKPGAPAAAPAAAAPPAVAPAVAAPAAPPVVDEEAFKLKILEEVKREFQPQLSAANKTFPSQFNPAIGFIVDTVLSYSQKDKAQFRVPLGRARPLGERRSLRSGLCHHQRHPGRDRGRGGGDRHDVAALQPRRQGRPVLRRLRSPVQVSRSRSAVREPADRARPLHRRGIAGRRGRGELARAAAPVPDAHGRRLQQDRRRERPGGQQHCRVMSRSSLTWAALRRSSASTTRTASTSG